MGNRVAVIVIGSGESARLVATRLRSAGAAGLTVTILGPGGAAPLPGWEPGLCRSLAQTADAVIARLADGRVIAADAAVLATGCASFGGGGALRGSNRQLPHHQGVAAGDDIVVLGTGSRAIRYALSAQAAGHRGRFILVGRLPPVRATGQAAAFDLSPADIPLGTGLRFLLRWFRQTAGWAAARGVGPRQLVNGLRPHVPLIWHHLSANERRRFVVHLRPYWLQALDSITPREQQHFAQLVQAGQVVFQRGRCVGLAPKARGVSAVIRHLPAGGASTIAAGLAVDFEDVPPGRAHFAGPVIAGLIQDGLARPDEIEYGLDVSENCALIDVRGRASARLFAVGAPTRGRFVDALDIDRIRCQSERVAQSIFASHFNSVN